MSRIFLAHASIDKPEVEWVAAALRRLDSSLEVFLDKWSLVPGDSLIGKIDDALLASDRLVVFLTGDSLASSWVRNELAAGLVMEIAKQRGGSKDNFVVPVLFKALPPGIPIPPLLGHKVYVDFVAGGDFDTAVRELHRGIQQVPLGPQDVVLPNLQVGVESFDGPAETPLGIRVVFSVRLTPERVNFLIDLGREYAAVDHYYQDRGRARIEIDKFEHRGPTTFGLATREPRVQQDNRLIVEFLCKDALVPRAAVRVSPFR